MAKIVTISHLKSIVELTFTVPRPGVHLLAGSNGSGKTTLLACLRRLGQPNAFPLHFAASVFSENIDNFSRARINYSVDGEDVTYSYAGERWVPRPRASSYILDAFGFPEVLYAGATAERLTPRSEDIQTLRTNPAPPAIVAAANAIFETERFTYLRTINLTTGNRNQAFLFNPPGAPRRYISEKNFSLGELCVLKLLRALNQCSNGSLVLIDELELALHPRAQLGLFRYLEELAASKALTIIVSTHSVTLLKAASREKIILLEKQNERTAVIEGCFPAYAIGNMASSEERAPDVVIYVEDEAAYSVTRSLVDFVIREQFPNGSFPTVSVTPIGDFQNVVRYYERSRTLLPDYVKQWVLLDHDVEAESLAIMAPRSNHIMRDLFHAHSGQIKYLPWSPEVGVMQFLNANRVDAEHKFRQHFMNAQLHIRPNLLTLPDLTGSELRKAAKRSFKQLVSSMHAQSTNISEEAIADHFYALLALNYFESQHGVALQLIAPLLR